MPKKTKTTKKKSDQIPLMTQKALIKETNVIVWECRHILEKFNQENTDLIRGLWTMCLNCYGYGDDLRNATFNFVKYPNEANKHELLKQVGAIHELHKQMQDLEFALRRDNYIDAHTRETSKNMN